jgi:hypothetical protein
MVPSSGANWKFDSACELVSEIRSCELDSVYARLTS